MPDWKGQDVDSRGTISSEGHGITQFFSKARRAIVVVATTITVALVVVVVAVVVAVVVV